ncbi:MAG: endonuclease III domain-containing protein [Candidatus Omnitrophica bacterium]|nr:endonuclease III domain-containing protein [Candidatus Omnitrophota bacterium]
MTRELPSIYKKLSACFGPQAWWPADTAFEVMVGAILTQNTNWGNVEKAIDNLKKYNLLSPSRLYQISQRRLATLIKPAGYFNIKARRLRHFLDFLLQTYEGNIKYLAREDLAKLRQRLLSVNGIGPETADSILLYALEKPIFVIDAYTKRILTRHRLIKANATYDEVQDLFMKNLKTQVKLFNEYHALLVRLGKEYCLKNKPRCDICPLR